MKTPFRAGLSCFLKMVRVSPKTHWHEQPRTTPNAPPKSTSQRAGPSCTGLFIARPLTVTGWFGAMEGSWLCAPSRRAREHPWHHSAASLPTPLSQPRRRALHIRGRHSGKSVVTLCSPPLCHHSPLLWTGGVARMSRCTVQSCGVGRAVGTPTGAVARWSHGGTPDVGAAVG